MSLSLFFLMGWLCVSLIVVCFFLSFICFSFSFPPFAFFFFSLLCCREEATRYCFPAGITLHLIPLFLSVTALAFTGVGGWDCTFFQGATIDFTGNNYGLWTLEDSNGKCQLWDVLFFSYTLGGPLITARIFSMTAMLLGLALVATMAQASQYHLASWGIGFVFLLLFMISVSTSSIFNVWVVFWLFTYAIMVLIIRSIFIHPVPRKITIRGSRIIAGLYLFCALFCLLTLVVLKSDFCTCSDITSQRLEGRNVGQPCNGSCSLRWAGYAMVVAAVFWILAAIACLKIGIQPETLRTNKRRPQEWYAHYPHQSIVTRAVNFVGGLASTTMYSSGGQSSNSAGGAAAGGGRRQRQQQQQRSGNSHQEQRQRPSQESHDDVVVVDGTKPRSIDWGDVAGNDESDSLRNLGIEGTEPITGRQRNMDDDQFNQEQVPTATTTNDDDDDDDNNNNNDNNDENILHGIHVGGNVTSYQNQQLDWNDLEDERSRCQKCCCDFRIAPRSRKEKIMFWSFRTVLGFGFVIYGLFIFMLIGSRVENTNAAKREETTPYFTTPWVCAFNPQDPYQPFESFPTQEDAHAQNWTIAHCGECGQCSNPYDIRRYVETRKSIAHSSKRCGPEVYLGTFGDLVRCLENRIGFTHNCTICWANNMVNTGEKCLSTCMRTLFSGFMTDNNVPGAGEQGWLNQCLFCDEKMSGPSLIIKRPVSVCLSVCLSQRNLSI